MSQFASLKCRGLHTFANNLGSLPEGALTVADNVVVDKQDTIEPRRGFRLYGSALPSSNDRASQLLTYKGRILRHYSSSLQFDNGAGIFTAFDGTYSEVDAGLRIKGVEVQGNFYFTTSDGIKKIAAEEAADISATSISSAGGIRATDISLYAAGAGNLTNAVGNPTVVTSTAHGLHTGQSITIINSNSTPTLDGTHVVTVVTANTFTIPVNVTVLGSAGSWKAATGYLSDGTTVAYRIVWGFKDVNDLQILGAPSGIAAISYGLSGTITGYTDAADTEVTTAAAHGLTSGQKITISNSGPATAFIIDGTRTITVTGASTFKFSPALDTSTGTTAGNTGTWATADTRDVQLNISIPADVTVNHFLQIYRTAPSTEGSPGDDHKLVYEANPTSAEITAKEMIVVDSQPNDLRDGGADLYTNRNSGEGINQANLAPPVARSITTYKNTVFLGNTRTRHIKAINYLGPSGITNGDYLLLAQTTTSTGTITASSVASPTAVTSTAHGLLTGDYVIITNSTGGVGFTPINGIYLITFVDANHFTIPVNVTVAGTTASWVKANIEKYTFAAVENYLSGNRDVLLASSGTASQNITDTSRSLVRVINKTSTLINAYDISSVDSNPGQLEFNAKTLADNHFAFFANNSVIADNFSPTLPVITAAIKSSDYSTNDVYKNRVYYSKTSQPESMPYLNFFDVGARDKAILNIKALRESLYIFKEDGIFRLVGDNASNFNISLFDSSANLLAPDTVAVLNNQIYLLSTQGVAVVSDTGVSIISNNIENLILNTTTTSYPNFAKAAFAVTSENDRSFMLFTVTNTADTYATQCFRFNVFTNTWVRWDISKRCGIVNLDNKIYLGATDTNYIEVERKDFAAIDHCDRDLDATIGGGVIVDNAVVFACLVVPTVGDVVLQTQYLTIAQFNRLLQKLDADAAVPAGAYYDTFKCEPGLNLAGKLQSLAAALDANLLPLSVTYAPLVSGSAVLATMQSEFNAVVNALNIDSRVQYTNYTLSSGTTVTGDAITSISTANGTISTAYSIPFIPGVARLYKAISCDVSWLPIHFGDPSMTKHVREATFIFNRFSFSTATAGFATDLSSGQKTVAFQGESGGTWGGGTWGGTSWGGEGTSRPFRTLIPREKQRCRYITPNFNHTVARESFALLGISFTFEPVSSRGYG